MFAFGNRRRRKGRRRGLRHAIVGLLAAAAAVCGPALWHPPAAAADSASVIMYHRFGESAYPSTNIQLEQFERHLRELADPGYSVLPLPEIVDRLRNGRPLPDRTVGISIDDAFLSVYTEAWPRLRKAGLPFTLFVATEAVDAKRRGYMSWEQIRELHRAGVSVGSQTHTHLDMATAGAAANRAEIETSNSRFLSHLGETPSLIAYPFGQYGLEVRRVVEDAGFVAGFGQHSGAFDAGSDMHYLPRFAMNQAYGGIARFRTAANALPLPVREFVPRDPLLADDGNPPVVGFTVPEALAGRLHRLNCYGPGGGVKPQLLGSRVEIRFEKPLPRGRSRLNCTMPGPDRRWRWFGIQFYLPGS